MNVWYLTTQFPVASETFACAEVRQLLEQRVDVSVHTLIPPPRAASRMLAERGISAARSHQGNWRSHIGALWTCLQRPAVTASLAMFVLRWSCRNLEHLIVSLLLIPRSVQLLAAIEAARPDVVHLFWGHYPALVGHLLQTYLPDQYLSHSLCAYDLTCAYKPTDPVASKAHLIRTHSVVNVPAIQGKGVESERILVVHRGIEQTSDESLVALPRVPRRIVSIGRLIASKGMDEVLRSFKLVQQVYPDSSLRILGAGPQRGSLEALSRRLEIAARVDFLGHVAPQAVRRELAQADIFLLLSRHESERLPNAAKEAMMMGCLCIVSETPGIEELLTDGEQGLVIPPHAQLAAQRILTCFAEPEKTNRLRASAQQRAGQQFDVRVQTRMLAARWEADCRKLRTAG